MTRILGMIHLTATGRHPLVLELELWVEGQRVFELNMMNQAISNLVLSPQNSRTNLCLCHLV